MEHEQWVFFFLMLASIAAAFLAYSLSYRKEKQISWKHPRILVEASILLVCIVIAVILKMKS